MATTCGFWRRSAAERSITCWDLLYLKGVDVGFVNTAIFDDFKKEGVIKNIENRIQYIS